MSKHHLDLLAQQTAPLVPAGKYRARWRWELDRSKELGWCKALLAIADEVHDARAEGKIVGPARGSGEGCLLLWLLGANIFDPLQHQIDPTLFFRSDHDSPPLSYWASFTQTPRFVCHPALADDRNVAPAIEDPIKQPPWSYDHWPSYQQILKRLPANNLEAHAIAFSLARPGPSGSGMLSAYLANPKKHRGCMFRDRATDTPAGEENHNWAQYKTYRGHALGQALLEACLSGAGKVIHELEADVAERLSPKKREGKR